VRVLILSHHGCIRVMKQGFALMRNHDVHFMQNSVTDEAFLLPMKECSFYTTRESLTAKLAVMPDFDVIHVHNEPDWLVTAAKKAKPNTPVVYDCHDLDSQRDGEKANPDEIEAMKVADAYIFPSQAYYEGASRYHSLPPHKPKAVVYSMCNQMSIGPLPRVRGIAYEGGIAAPVEGYNYTRYPAYRDHRALVEAMYYANIPIALYGVSDIFMNQYRSIGALCFPPMPYVNMLRELTRWDWGFVGCAEKYKTMEGSMPNKLFEYVAAGIPVIACNSPEAERFVVDNELGVSVDSIEDINDIYDTHEEWREKVREKKDQFIMEREIDKVERIYRMVTE
jgi:hypothetical protein